NMATAFQSKTLTNRPSAQSSMARKPRKEILSGLCKTTSAAAGAMINREKQIIKGQFPRRNSEGIKTTAGTAAAHTPITAIRCNRFRSKVCNSYVDSAVGPVTESSNGAGRIWPAPTQDLVGSPNDSADIPSALLISSPRTDDRCSQFAELLG